MPGINPQGYGPIPQAPPGGGVNFGHVGQALWNILKVIGTPNQGSATGGLLASLANQGHNPMNLAMFLAGGPKGSPVENASWLEPYNMPKAMSGGHVTFREGQPYDVQSKIKDTQPPNLNRAWGSLQRIAGHSDPDIQDLIARVSKLRSGTAKGFTPGDMSAYAEGIQQRLDQEGKLDPVTARMLDKAIESLGGGALGSVFKESSTRQVHDALFGGTVHMTPGHNIPPRP